MIKMTLPRSFCALALATVLAVPAMAQVGRTIGMITYWGPDPASYDIIPDGAMATINPDNGILKSRGQKLAPVGNLANWRQIVAQSNARGISMLGYVPTGYFNHDCNAIGKCQTWERIEKQVEVYFKEIEGLGGIFFDEAAPANWSCDAFVNEYAKLRAIVRNHSATATIAFNAGVPDNCVVGGGEAGEILVLFEGNPQNYSEQAERLSVSARTAREKGARVWHLVHSVSSNEEIAQLYGRSQSYGADYFYVTMNSGDWEAGVNTWGR
jgi:hypothetical protein